ncbi:hypothetical protein [Actinomadura sp. GTD37]|uniref:hypothetical protein n=1 Tax=Actinomadura sp. GTD37 TaxID=1778030 RepID=UPI0035BF85B1
MTAPRDDGAARGVETASYLSDLPTGDDLAVRLRRDLRRAAAPLRAAGLSTGASPLWMVEPYADPDACWGCGLEPAHEPHPMAGLLLCWWCRELHEVDRANQRRERDRGRAGLIL